MGCGILLGGQARHCICAKCVARFDSWVFFVRCYNQVKYIQPVTDVMYRVIPGSENQNLSSAEPHDHHRMMSHRAN